MHLLATGSPVPTEGVAGWVVSVMGSLGAPGAGLLVALENVFPPLPSEVILPLAGFSASLGTIGLTASIVWTTAGSVVGAWVLYGLGAWLGQERLNRLVDRLPFVDVEDVRRAEAWFDRHGYASILVGRVVPVVRSLISIPAGVQRMPLLVFSVLTLIGSGIWNATLIGAGYALGSNWGVVQEYVGVLEYVVIALLVGLVVRYIFRRVRRTRARGVEQRQSAEDTPRR